MIGTVKRKIAEEKIRNSTCSHCQEQNTLVATVFSKVFVLKILPFVTGKSSTLACSHCKKDYSDGAALDPSTQRRVDAIKEEANHPWFLYLGYVLIGAAMIMALIKEQ